MISTMSRENTTGDLTGWFSKTNNKVVRNSLDQVLYRGPFLMRARQQLFEIPIRVPPVQNRQILHRFASEDVEGAFHHIVVRARLQSLKESVVNERASAVKVVYH